MLLVLYQMNFKNLAMAWREFGLQKASLMLPPRRCAAYHGTEAVWECMTCIKRRIAVLDEEIWIQIGTPLEHACCGAVLQSFLPNAEPPSPAL